MVGASRERVNKAIATFVRLGWLSDLGAHALPHPRPRRARGPHLGLTRSCGRLSGVEPGAKPREVARETAASSGAVRWPIGVVHEAVVGALDDDDLAVVATGPRGAQRVDVGGRGHRRRPSRRSRASGTRRPRSRAAGRCAGPSHASGESDHAVEGDGAVEAVGRGGLRGRNMPPMQKPSTPTLVTPSSTTSRSAAAERSPSTSSSSSSDAQPIRVATSLAAALGLATCRANGSIIATANPCDAMPRRHVVEQRPDAHDVGMEDDARDRHAVGSCVHDRHDRVAANERAPLDRRFLGPSRSAATADLRSS